MFAGIALLAPMLTGGRSDYYSKLGNLVMQVPNCCRNCHYYEWDAPDDGLTIWRYCLVNVVFPTKKGKCKRQKKDYEDRITLPIELDDDAGWYNAHIRKRKI